MREEAMSLEEVIAEALAERDDHLRAGEAERVAAAVRAWVLDDAQVERAGDAIDAWYPGDECKACDNTGEEANWVTGDWGPCSVHPRYESGLSRAALRALFGEEEASD